MPIQLDLGPAAHVHDERGLVAVPPHGVLREESGGMRAERVDRGRLQVVDRSCKVESVAFRFVFQLGRQDRAVAACDPRERGGIASHTVEIHRQPDVLAELAPSLIVVQSGKANDNTRFFM